jgi:hypothetical protein
VTTTYHSSIFHYEYDTTSLNPFIGWYIEPEPADSVTTVLRIAKVTEGETPESALKKNGIDINVCGTSFYQHNQKPALDENSRHALQVKIKNRDVGDYTYATSIIEEFNTSKIDFNEAELASFTLATYIYTHNNNSYLYFDVTPLFPIQGEDIIEWYLVEVNPCPMYATNMTVSIDGSVNCPPSWVDNCRWSSVSNRVQLVYDAIDVPGGPLPNPVMREYST